MSHFIKLLVIASVVGMFATQIAAADDAPQIATIVRLPKVDEIHADDSKWCLKLPHDTHLIYRGVVGFDEAGLGRGAMLYPAPGFVGFLAAIATHGLIIESAKNAEKIKMQDGADKVLLPYKVVLDKFDYRELMRRTSEKVSHGMTLIEDAEKTGGKLLIESVPVFSLTQDQTAIILDNAIVIHRPDDTTATVYQKVIRVISTATKETDLATFWTASDGEKIKDKSAQLVAESLEISFNDLTDSKTDDIPYKTIRYQEGATEKMERAQLLSTHCGRMLIRNLRGALMSVPASHPDQIDRCDSNIAHVYLNTDIAGQ